MKILAIDPGTAQSAYLVWDDDTRSIQEKGIIDNAQLLSKLYADDMKEVECLSIEMVQSFGMAVGQETFETVFWIGRFYEVSEHWMKMLFFRKDIKLHICGTTRAKDPNIRQALIDKYGKPGTKANPNPVYNDSQVKMAKDLWSALAVLDITLNHFQ